MAKKKAAKKKVAATSSKKKSAASKKKSAAAASAGGPRVSYHVVPAKQGGWDVKQAGKPAVISHHDTKTIAVEAGRKLAKGHSLGQLRVHKQTGEIQTEYTYGADPTRYKG